MFANGMDGYKSEGERMNVTESRGEGLWAIGRAGGEVSYVTVSDVRTAKTFRLEKMH